MPESLPRPLVHVSGVELRYVLTDLICGGGEDSWTVRSLVEALAGAGLRVSGRPSKEISDALRWEVRRGRVRRLARGVYGAGAMPGATRRRIRTRSRELRARAEREAWDEALRCPG